VDNNHKIQLKNKAVPIEATNHAYISTIDNGGNYVEMNISDAQSKYSSFEITPGHILLNTPFVDFATIYKGQNAYFELKNDPNDGLYVYSIFIPSSGAELELYRVTLEGGIVLNELTFKGTGTTVGSCLRDPNWFLPCNILGTVDITQKIGMTPVSITVDSPVQFTMNFNDSVRDSPFSRETTDFDKVRMTVYVQWTDGNYQQIGWFTGINNQYVKSQVYNLTDEPLPNIKI
jgi:hypothetical protein